MPSCTRTLLAAWASLLLVAAAPGSARAACPGESNSAPELTTDQYELSVLCLVNERRIQIGKSDLELNPALTRAAVRQSEAMITRGFFSHRWPSGRSLNDRIDAAGYMRGAEQWSYGENLAWGYGGRSTPLSIVDGWMNSPPHRENLLR